MERGLFRKVHLLEILEILDSREFRDVRDSREDCGKQRESDHILEPLGSFKFRDTRDPSSEKICFIMTPFSSPDF